MKRNDNSIPVSSGDLVEPENIANGPVLILLVILLVAVLGGMYRWFVVLNNKDIPTIMTSSRPTEAQNKEPESPTAQAQTEAYKVVSNSDEVPAIEADIEGTNLDSLDSELNAIDAEIDAAVGGRSASSSAQ